MMRTRRPAWQTYIAAMSVVYIVYTLQFFFRSPFGDLRILHFGGRLMGRGDVDVLYDAERFVAATRAESDGWSAPSELATFIAPPTMAWAMSLFGVLSFPLAAVLWTGLGIAAAVAATRLLELPAWMAVVAILGPAGWLNLRLGQTGFFVLLVAAVLFVAVRDDRPVLAGVALGLTIIKPTILLGVALWWLIDARRRRIELLAAALTGVVIAAVATVGGAGIWVAFASGTTDRVERESSSVFDQPVVVEFVRRSVSASIPGEVVFGLCVVAALALLCRVRRAHDEPMVSFGAAVMVSMLVSPHLLSYDTGLVLVVIAVARWCGVDRSQWGPLVALWVVASALSAITFELVSGWIGWAPWPLTIAYVVLFIRWAQVTSAAEGRRSSALQSVVVQPM